MKKIVCFLLSMTMLFGCFGMSAHAEETIYPTTICTLHPEDYGDYGAPLSSKTLEASAQSFEEIVEEGETSILDNDDWISKLVKELDGIF